MLHPTLAGLSLKTFAIVFANVFIAINTHPFYGFTTNEKIESENYGFIYLEHIGVNR
jgi:hypothetical protein